MNKEDYYYNLSSVTQRNSWNEWIMFMLDAIENTSINTNGKINDIIAQMESTLQYAKGKIKWYSKELNELLFSQPYIKPKTIGNLIGKTSRTTLTKYMNELVEARIFRPKKIGTEVYYINDDLLIIIED